MNKTELIRFAAVRANCSQPVMKRCLEAIISTIVDNVSVGETVKINNFGLFYRKKKAATVGRDLNKNTTVDIPERIIPAFLPGKEFKHIVEEMTRGRK